MRGNLGEVLTRTERMAEVVDARRSGGGERSCCAPRVRGGGGDVVLNYNKNRLCHEIEVSHGIS